MIILRWNWWRDSDYLIGSRVEGFMQDVIKHHWVFITGGCSGRMVQWMGVVLYDKIVYNII